jgi:hypothetical protein
VIQTPGPCLPRPPGSSWPKPFNRTLVGTYVIHVDSCHSAAAYDITIEADAQDALHLVSEKAAPRSAHPPVRGDEAADERLLGAARPHRAERRVVKCGARGASPSVKCPLPCSSSGGIVVMTSIAHDERQANTPTAAVRLRGTVA